MVIVSYEWRPQLDSRQRDDQFKGVLLLREGEEDEGRERTGGRGEEGREEKGRERSGGQWREGKGKGGQRRGGIEGKNNLMHPLSQIRVYATAGEIK